MKDRFSKKIKYTLMAVCSGILIVQCIYALVWMWHNLNTTQDFNETIKYVELANTLKGDSWYLLGYPIFLKLFVSLEKIIGDCYVVLIYVVQVAVSYTCFTYGCKVMAELLYQKQIKLKKVLLPAVYSLTVPIVWQMQFALLPDALCLAMLVLVSALITECIRKYRRPGIGKMIFLFCITILLGVFQRHYFYAALFMILCGALIVLMRAIKNYIKEVKFYIIITAILLSVCVMPAMMNILNQVGTSEDSDIIYSVELDLWERFVYPNIVFDYAYYTPEIKSALTEETCVVGSEYWEYYRTKIASEMQQNAGKDAKRLYGEMVRISYAVHKGDIISQTVKESIAYILIPIAMEKYMYHNANSLYGYNVTRMYEQCPGITMDFLHMGMNGFMIVSALGILLFLLKLFRKSENTSRNIAIIAYYLGMIVCGTIPIMLFSVAKFDYRIGLFSIYIYGAVSTLSIFESVIKRAE